MANFEIEAEPMLSERYARRSDRLEDSNFRRLISRTRSAPMSVPMVSMEPYDREIRLGGDASPLRSARETPFPQMSGPLSAAHGTGNPLQQSIVVTGNKVAGNRTEKFSTLRGAGESYWSNNYDRGNEHLLRSGRLGMCNDPYCTTCPTYLKAAQQGNSRTSNRFDPKFRNVLYGDAKGFARKVFSFCTSGVPRVMNPHTKVVQQWNKILVIFCLVAVFLDPLFFFSLYVQKDNKCINISWTMATTLVLFRSLNDLVYFLNILLQFRLAYISPESRVVGAGDLVDHPKKIALHYLRGYFLLDLFVVIPLPQIMILFVLPSHLGSSGANYAKNLQRAAMLVQYIPRLFRFLPLLIGQSPTGFMFESAWANFIMNLLFFMLSGHLVGSCGYLFALQRVNHCLRDACLNSNIIECMPFIDCGHVGSSSEASGVWNNNSIATACLSSSSGAFDSGIYADVVPLTIGTNVVKKYVFALFWGFMQISSLAGNQTPSNFEWEVFFTMSSRGMGLLLFALLIGNIQNFLQGPGRRRLEMQLRGHDVEQWMSHHRLSEDLRRRVRQAERYNWAATRGVNEEMLMENMPEDLQRDIRRHFFYIIKKVRLFAMMDEPILDAIRERLRKKIYIKGSTILYPGDLVERMVFVVRGKLESIGEDGTRVYLSDGDACCEELLIWCLENSSVRADGRKIWLPEQRLLSSRTVMCLTNVEAFSLRAADLEEVIILFTRFLQSPRVQGAIRYQSPYWRSLAATRIQVAWRYRKKQVSRAASQSVQTWRL